nr:hypothetical protein [uncultured Psychroserpens sp.]
MKKVILSSLATIVVSFGVITLIFVSNDHSECSQIQEIKTANNSQTVVTTNKHVCKEKFNL